jgi:hypothetical protein
MPKRIFTMILGSLVVACANDTTMSLFMQEIGYFHATTNLFAEKLELHFFYRASTRFARQRIDYSFLLQHWTGLETTLFYPAKRKRFEPVSI